MPVMEVRFLNSQNQKAVLVSVLQPANESSKTTLVMLSLCSNHPESMIMIQRFISYDDVNGPTSASVACYSLQSAA